MGKKNENPFLCYLCNTYLYSVEIERYYMKNVYLKDLNLKNYIVFTCFFLHQSRRARKQRYLAARRALPGTVPPAPSQFSHPRTPSYALSTQWRSHTPPPSLPPADNGIASSITRGEIPSSLLSVCPHLHNATWSRRLSGTTSSDGFVFPPDVRWKIKAMQKRSVSVVVCRNMQV